MALQRQATVYRKICLASVSVYVPILLQGALYLLGADHALLSHITLLTAKGLFTEPGGRELTPSRLFVTNVLVNCLEDIRFH